MALTIAQSFSSMPFGSTIPLRLAFLEWVSETVLSRTHQSPVQQIQIQHGSLFRYGLQVMPAEVTESIGTSTLLAAWNPAIYVVQIDDRRVVDAMTCSDYLDATREVVVRHGGLWFTDESFVVARKRR